MTCEYIEPSRSKLGLASFSAGAKLSNRLVRKALYMPVLALAAWQLQVRSVQDLFLANIKG